MSYYSLGFDPSMTEFLLLFSLFSGGGKCTGRTDASSGFYFFAGAWWAVVVVVGCRWQAASGPDRRATPIEPPG